MKIAVFGSAFNPPTRGHKDAIDYIVEYKPQIEKVLLIPSFRHAFSKSMIAYDVRCKLVELFVHDMANNKCVSFPIEHKIATNQKPVYTHDVLTYLQSVVFPDDELYFVVGPDNLAHWNSFYKADEIKTKWQLISVPERVNIRSTKVRQKIQKSHSINDLVTPSVNEFIHTNHLYQM